MGPWSNNQRIEILDVGQRARRRVELVLDHALGDGLGLFDNLDLSAQVGDARRATV